MDKANVIDSIDNQIDTVIKQDIVRNETVSRELSEQVLLDSIKNNAYIAWHTYQEFKAVGFSDEQAILFAAKMLGIEN